MVNFRRKNGQINGPKRSKNIPNLYPNCPNDTKTVSERSKTQLKRFPNGQSNENGVTTVSKR